MSAVGELGLPAGPAGAGGEVEDGVSAEGEEAGAVGLGAGALVGDGVGDVVGAGTGAADGGVAVGGVAVGGFAVGGVAVGGVAVGAADGAWAMHDVAKRPKTKRT